MADCKDRRPTDDGPTRRSVIQGSAAATALLAVGIADAVPALAQLGSRVEPAGGTTRIPVDLIVNASRTSVELDPRTTLLDALRHQLGLTGSKKGCDHGQCGACTVLINGRRVNSCLTLAVMHQGDEITTIEGLARGEALHPMQAAFIARDGFQCGYCTPGQICSAVGMLNEAKAGWPSHVTDDLAAQTTLSDAEIRERMSGNLCRCAAYPNIVAAIRDVAERT
jgi:xanthine dehydrogenase YagT iron-sulfur-binding subunit